MHQKWEDISEYVVHFTKEHGGKAPYENVMSILGRGCLDRRMIVPYIWDGRERPRIHDKLRAIIEAYRGEPTADASYNS